MKTFEFFLLFEENVWLYLSLWLTSFIIYRVLFWRVVRSIFDPIYFFVIFTNSICTANVIFLGVLGEIKYYYTTVYFVSEIAFLIGMLLQVRPQQVIDAGPSYKFLVMRIKRGMFLTIALSILTSLWIYAERGIPLFLDSRGDASAGGSGFGFVARISQIAASLFVLFYFSKSKVTGRPNTPVEKGMFYLSIVLGVLSGYKAFFIFYLFAYFVTQGRDGLPDRKKELYVILAGFVLMIVLFVVVSDSPEISLALLALLSRVLASGDIYYMAFVGDAISHLQARGFFFQIFGTLLASFRIINWDLAPLNYGIAINELVNNSDLNLGPTFRYNVLWLLLTGSVFLTGILSFFIGLCIGFLSNKTYKYKKISLKHLFISLFYYKSFLLVLGPDQAVSDIVISLLIVVPIFIILLMPSLNSTGNDA